ncbi:hypothetical protein Droror1_Dr00020132, partial [Drosera rotundifolia]
MLKTELKLESMHAAIEAKLKKLDKKIKTVEVCNVSLDTLEQDIKEFFSFSGDIEYVEFH